VNRLKSEIAILLMLLICAALLCVVAANAQSISPLRGEGGKGRVHGSFTITNTTLKPIVVTVEAHGFSLDKQGRVTVLPLDKYAVVTLSETSARIGVQQAHRFDYTVECLQPHCMIVFTASNFLFNRAEKSAGGFLARLVLEHFAYICQDGGSGCRLRIRKELGVEAP